MVVDHAQGAQGVACAVEQRRARIEGHVRRAGHQRVSREARVLVGVRHHQRLACRQDRVRAKCVLPGRLAGLQPELGLEPLALLVHQGHQGDGRVAQRGGLPHQGVDVVLRRSVKDLEGAQRL
jgi:hypothetical protein